MFYVQVHSAGRFLSQNPSAGLHAPHIAGVRYTAPYREKVGKQKDTVCCIGFS